MEQCLAMYELYKGLPRARGRYKITKSKDGEKVQGNATTIREPYTPECWKKHLSGIEGLGVIPITDEGTCSWGAIDIDKYPLDIETISEQLAALELPVIVIRSKSGGAHLTVFFSEMIQCTDVRRVLVELAASLGHGGCEIYPKQVKLASLSDVGNWLNMPYFDGDNTNRYALYGGKKLSVDEFITTAMNLRQPNTSGLTMKSTGQEFEDGPPCLQTMCASGKISEGGRNNAMFNIGVYTRLKYESTWDTELEKFNHTALESPITAKEVIALMKSLERKNYSYTCNTPPISNNCNRELCKRRDFGITAFQHVDIGVVLDSVQKMNSEPPIWIISIDGVRTEIETDELLEQNRFRKVCVNAINKIPGRMKAEEWDKFIRTKLQGIEIIEVPMEAKISARAVDYMKSFIDSYPQARHIDEVSLGRWFVDNNHYIMRGSDYTLYLERQGLKIDTRRLWNVLTGQGVVFGTESVRGIPTQVWKIPLSMYGAPKGKFTRMEIADENF
jgi:hypothetical protein